MNQILTHAQFRRQFAATPMSGAITRLFARGGQDLGAERRRELIRLLSRVSGIEPFHTRGKKTPLPSDDRGSCRSEALPNRRERCALGQKQDQSRPENVAGRERARLCDARQIHLLLFGKTESGGDKHSYR